MCTCGCSNHSHQTLSTCDPCATTGCPIQLDFECLLYNKANNEVSNLTNLGLTNGATLKLFAELVDSYIGQIKVADYNLPCLRDDYVINTLKQFAEAVDVELCQIRTDVATLQSLVNLPITGTDTQSVNLTVSGIGSHTIQAEVIISGQANNLLSSLVSGLYVAPQTLSVNYTTKEMTISNGNTVSFAGLTCGVGGFLGNVSSDPTAVLDGQYWFNITSGELKIQVNGLTKIITIV